MSQYLNTVKNIPLLLSLWRSNKRECIYQLTITRRRRGILSRQSALVVWVYGRCSQRNNRCLCVRVHFSSGAISTSATHNNELLEQGSPHGTNNYCAGRLLFWLISSKSGNGTHTDDKSFLTALFYYSNFQKIIHSLQGKDHQNEFRKWSRGPK